ncbi:hypothetical protein EUTSA_v10005267mg [Eutrema salsugineum]|uniref:GCK domain-containing protein n=1 Tax=Eutrema salsugineum TaxID=72664 RepID=V4KSQ5_EUTSA|nr:hypothetical protein EUTSA_v10005267mg [Eutrema salsugineum]
MSSSTNLNAKSGNDPLAHQGEESSANPQDQNKSNTANSEEDKCWVRRYLKKGECKDSFLEADKCVDDEDDVNKCRDATIKFMTCMYANQDYYGLYLGEKKAALTRELDMLEEAEAAAAKKKESEELKGK